MASSVEVCNLALQKLGARRIASLSEDSKNARACSAAYDSVRRQQIRKYRWNFAIKRTTLAPDGSAPAFDFAYQFTLPSDCLRVIKNEDTTDWVTEGRKILTNEGNVLYLRYLADITDVNEWDGQFRLVMAAALAYQICEEITQSSSKKADVEEEYKMLVAEAKASNSIEHVVESIQDDSWVTARQ